MPTSDERTATEAPLLSPPLPDDHRYLSRGVSRGMGLGGWMARGGEGSPERHPASSSRVLRRLLPFLLNRLS